MVDAGSGDGDYIVEIFGCCFDSRDNHLPVDYTTTAEQYVHTSISHNHTRTHRGNR